LGVASLESLSNYLAVDITTITLLRTIAIIAIIPFIE